MIDIVGDGLSLKCIAILSGINECILKEYVISNHFKTLKSHKTKESKFSISDSKNIINGLQSEKNLQILKKKFSFYNFKGGVGKTSICFQLSSHIARLLKRLCKIFF